MYANLGFLGSKEEEYYAKAKASLAKYNELLSRIDRVANKESRDALKAQVGSAASESSIAYRASSVQQDVSEAEKWSPPNTYVWSISRRQGRVDELASMVTGLEPQVAEAEKRFGVLPGPVSVTKTVLEREFLLGLPLKTWLWIAGGVATVTTIGLVAAAAKR